MFYYIKGTYVLSGDSFMVVDTNGIGYKIYTPLKTIDKARQSEEPVTVYIHEHIRDDTFDLYGFLNTDELSCFRMLLSVSGVGPKVALGILSELGAAGLAKSVATADQKSISRAPGIGVKLAKRIILELKDKIVCSEFTDTDDSVSDLELPVNRFDELTSALISLGYSRREADSAARKVVKEDLSLEEQVKKCLKLLMK